MSNVFKISLHLGSYDQEYHENIPEGYTQIAAEDLYALIKKFELNGEFDMAEQLKSYIPVKNAYGFFEGDLDENLLTHYDGLIWFRISDINFKNIPKILKKLDVLRSTFLWFDTFIENSMIIIVKVNTGPSYHKEAFTQVADFYDKELGLKVDRYFHNDSLKPNSITDDCMYFNPNCIPFKVVLEDNSDEIHDEVKKLKGDA